MHSVPLCFIFKVLKCSVLIFIIIFSPLINPLCCQRTHVDWPLNICKYTVFPVVLFKTSIFLVIVWPPGGHHTSDCSYSSIPESTITLIFTIKKHSEKPKGNHKTSVSHTWNHLQLCTMGSLQLIPLQIYTSPSSQKSCLHLFILNLWVGWGGQNSWIGI